MRKMRSWSTEAVRAGLRAWMPSMNRMSLSPSFILRLSSITLFPSLKSYRGMTTSLPASRSLRLESSRETFIAPSDSKSYSPFSSLGVWSLGTK